ncbi:MAG: thiamine phosphate synthase [Candidatus Omnitrophica bacterium]|nr:thiamine phosphate synthase [Candidatus Omnitrophota bacterium]MDD5573875.1 thiamine phosphate synthase [Candidatus Omnitrophota bacterium]
MNWKKQHLKNSRLYLILDKDVCGPKKLQHVLSAALAGGVDIVQLRDKTSTTKEMIALARPLAAVARAAKRLFIINDRIDVAEAVGADGLHLGQDDAPAAIARKFLGSDALIGISCHSPKDVRESLKMPVDYLGFGPVFPTLTKPGMRPRGLKLLHQAISLTSRPVFAIGGIDLGRLRDIRTTGSDRVAVCREICLSPHITRAAERLKQTLTNTHV